MTMKTASQALTQALAEGAALTVDHETRAFVGFRFHLSTEERATVVRVHRQAPEFSAVLSAATA